MVSAKNSDHPLSLKNRMKRNREREMLREAEFGTDRREFPWFWVVVVVIVLGMGSGMVLLSAHVDDQTVRSSSTVASANEWPE